MKKFCLAVFLIVPIAAWSQAIPNNVRSQFALDRLTKMNFTGMDGTVVGLAAPPGRVVGNTYIDQKWNMGSVLIAEKNTPIEGYPMKYDIKAQNLEIKTVAGVRLLDVKKIGHVVWVDSLTKQPHYFVNAARYKEDGTPLVGLLEVVVDGQRSLLKRTVLSVKTPTYVAALDVGNRDTEISKKTKFFYSEGENVVEVTSKKKLLESFGDQGDEVKKFMKLNKLDVNQENHLSHIFEFYNSKVGTN